MADVEHYTLHNALGVMACTVTALPAYTYANGASGVGATITANANGAFPTIDGVSLTAQAATGVNINARSTATFLLHHGAAASDNGVYMLTTQGSGGAPWVATRLPGFDTSALIPDTAVIIRRGLRMAGAELTYRQRATLTIGTTAIFYWRVGKNDPNYWVSYSDDFINGASPAIASVTGPGPLTWAASGAGVAFSAGAANNNIIRGSVTGVTGTTATAFGGICDAWTAVSTAPGGGGSFVPSANVGFRIEFLTGVTVLSTGAQEFSRNIGLAKQRAASQVLPADFIGFLYDRLTSVNWQACTAVGGVSTGTKIDTGIPVAAGNFYRFTIEKFPGDATVYLDLNGTNYLTTTTNVPSAEVLGMLDCFFKSVGITTTGAYQVDYVSYDLQLPAGRAA